MSQRVQKIPEPFPEPILKPFPESIPEPFPEVMEVSMLESYWLAPHHPIPNSKFPPIATLQNRST